MSAVTSPFFWALVSLIGIHAATVAVSGHPIGRNRAFIALALVMVTLGRVVLVLPLCAQPRLAPRAWLAPAGIAVMVLAALIAAPALSVRWWRPPEPGMRLRTSGIYGIVRHPIYLAEVLWPAGWSLVWGSVWGLALTPAWWLAFLLHALVEEQQLERVLGDEYRRYRARVRGRFVPGLPI
ncbi:MAG: DUF1295 domain-containing protein [Acidobacteria bacterium]|nr:MAG: DUF1295 domain-containing protein [Acidobacteriota bacterium]